MTAEMIPAEEAYRIGLVEKVVPAESLMEEGQKTGQNHRFKSSGRCSYGKDGNQQRFRYGYEIRKQI